MTTRARALLGTLALASTIACGGESSAPPTSARPSTPPSSVAAPPSSATHDPHEVGGTHTTEAPRDVPPARVARVSGEASTPAGPITQGASLEHGERLTLGDGAELALDLPDGDRITVFGPAVARVGVGGIASLELGRGSAHIVLPPGPAGPRSPLRVASPEASVEMVGPGEVLLVVDPSGASWVVALSGLSRTGNGEGDARHHARLAELAPGQAILYVDHPAEPTEAPTRLEDARAAAQVLFAQAAPAEPARRAARARQAATDLDTALGWLEGEQRHGHDLTEEHRAAVAGGRQDDATRLMGQLVAHAQELHALRTLAEMRWERLAALVTAGAIGAGDPDPAAARQERAAALLGFE